MKEYRLVFKALSTFSSLPNSQTIFGAICNILLNTQGEEAFNNYIHSLDDKPLFIHSSMYPLHLLPMINYSIFDINYINRNILHEDYANQLNYLQKMKSYKKISYIQEEVVQDYFLNNKLNKLRDDLLNKQLLVNNNCLLYKNNQIDLQMNTQLNTHVHKLDLYNIDNELYYDTTTYSNNLFYILIKTDKDIKEIEKIFSYSHLFGFGSRHSVGKNSFEFMYSEEVIRDSNSKYKILLSQSCFDEAIDLDNSNYQIISKQHHASKHYLNRLTHKVNLFKEGSYLKLNHDCQYTGKLLSLNIDNKPLYYYAIGYII